MDTKQGCGFSGDLPIEGWETLAKTLLELAELDPPIGIPIILAFVTTTNERIIEPGDDETGEFRRPRRVTEYQFQEELAGRLFDYDRLRPLIAESSIPEDIDQSIRKMWKPAKAALMGRT